MCTPVGAAQAGIRSDTRIGDGDTGGGGGYCSASTLTVNLHLLNFSVMVTAVFAMHSCRARQGGFAGATPALLCLCLRYKCLCELVDFTF